MELISNGFLAAGAFGAAVYCYVLALRLKKFQTLESGMGGAIAVLSAQVDDMTLALEKARVTANGQATALEDMTRRGETVAAKLELMLASMHDLPGDPACRPTPEAAAPDDQTERRLRFVRRRTTRDRLEAAE